MLVSLGVIKVTVIMLDNVLIFRRCTPEIWVEGEYLSGYNLLSFKAKLCVSLEKTKKQMQQNVTICETRVKYMGIYCTILQLFYRFEKFSK